ncbi:thiamine pyrophosphate-binding protein, partial [Salmonella enterica subsp. enterica serovar Montevideo]|nr:thiamine pyrophosphate-binding protein [Salmonella enterica subsp. enterica serovar Montevideo]
MWTDVPDDRDGPVQNELPQVMSDAFRLAQSGRPGPVWIDVPKDVQTATIELDALPS